MMIRYPEPLEQIRYRDHAHPQITHVVMRLDDGRRVSFYEVAIRGQVLACADLDESLTAIRQGS